MNLPIKKKLAPGLLKLARPEAGQSPLLRHAGWSRALAGRFLQRTNVQEWQPESQVYRQHAAAQYFLSRNLQRFHVSSASDPGRLVVNHFIFKHKSVFHSAQPAGKEGQGTHRQRHEATPPASALGAVHHEKNHLPLERAVERYRISCDGLRGMVLFVASGQDAIEIRKRILRYENVEAGAPLLDLARRIARQVCREEQGPLGPPPDILSGPPAVHGRGDFVLELPRFVPVKELSAESTPNALPGAPPAMPFNVVQLTDEVMRQLDHRLIAARERMGKI
jgi:hypothetical protein